MESTIGIQIMYGAAVIGAGAVGATTLFVPGIARRYIFAGEVEPDPFHRILGALWLALGLVAALGLFDPATFLPVLLIQLIYKFVWVLIVGYPAIASGNRTPGIIFFTALFTIWVIALISIIPFQMLI